MASIKRYQRPGDSIFVMELRRGRYGWRSLAKCATHKAAMPTWRRAVREGKAVEMVYGATVGEARHQAHLQYEPKRKARENPTCGTCEKPVATYGDFCNETCRKDWEAVAGALSQMNAAVGGALASPKQ